ncbi:SAV_6107 family HEPN domain-containing protein [Streptomyces xiaopingdaonensis]|uniref:SAV_6107 family HEPN domain-containing protein n=1 Tax=Streptomyces xiaopingdaonensis TaxID=1565415 RepID=UPI0003193BD7|nr:SAV_6107 family HEPN domain-containing protein [Streptomyces xiaopingdaonensis]
MARTSRTPPPEPSHRRAQRDVHPVLRRAATPPAVLELLAQAQFALDEAAALNDPNDRYAAAHFAALRTAAAVLAAPGRPEPPRPHRALRTRPARRPIRSAWESLPEAAPELAEWSAYFAAGARRRQLAEAGVPGAADEPQARELLRAAGAFLRSVERMLVDQPALPGPRTAGGEGAA